MKTSIKSGFLLVAVCLLLLWTNGVSAEEKAVESVKERVAAEDNTASLERLDPEDLEQIKKLVARIASTKKFSGVAEYGYDVLQATGQMIEFGGTRKFIYHQPDKLRFENVDRDGTISLVTYDGKQLIYATTNENVYAMIDLPGNIETAMDFLQDEFGLATPLGDFLETIAADETSAVVTQEVIASAYAGKSTIRGVVCDHLAFRTNDVDFQLWISDGEDPQVQRYIITYKDEKGKPQFWVNLSGWNMADTTPEADFTFHPPAEMREIPLIRLYPDEFDEAGEIDDGGEGMDNPEKADEKPKTNSEGGKQ